MKKFELSSSQVYKSCPADIFDEENIKKNKNYPTSITHLESFERFHLGTTIKQRGYNIFVIGENGLSKKRTVLNFLKNERIPVSKLYDLLYVYNFKNPDNPRSLCLEASEGSILQKDMQKTVNKLQVIIPAIFESKQYKNFIKELGNTFTELYQENFLKIQKQAKKSNLILKQGTKGLEIQMLNEKEEPLSQEEFAKLTITKQKSINSKIQKIEASLEDLVLSSKYYQKDKQDKIITFTKELISKKINPLFQKLQTKWQHNLDIIDYLKCSYDYIIENYLMFYDISQGDPEEKAYLLKIQKKQDNLKVNIIVNQNENTHKNERGIPVKVLNNLSFERLFGKIEITPNTSIENINFNNIKAGALHKLNGGYLIISVKFLLENALIWEKLKFAIKSYNINITTLDALPHIKPEPIALNIKIILISNPKVYYELWNIDPELQYIFKILCKINSFVPYIKENSYIYQATTDRLKKIYNILPLTNCANARLVEVGAKLTNSQRYLTTNKKKIANLLFEANYLAINEKLNKIDSQHITDAFFNQKTRTSDMYKYLHNSIKNQTILIKTKGEEIGQINGLATYLINDFMFGYVQRITSVVYKGNDGLLDIEKAVNLSGSSHYKGILILQSFLKGRFGQKGILSFSGTISFEQSYTEIDGDSATCAEYFCVVSSLTRAPLKQSIAVTGSMDQAGRVQAIGGVNQKVFGYFYVCQQEGLDGSQGVIIPKANVKDLMLEKSIREAIDKGLFHIYAISHVDEGIEILTGKKAGILDNNTWTKNSINDIISRNWLVQNES